MNVANCKWSLFKWLNVQHSDFVVYDIIVYDFIVYDFIYDFIVYGLWLWFMTIVFDYDLWL